MHRVFLAQAVKPIPHLVLAPDFRVHQIKGFQVEVGSRGDFLTDAEIAFVKGVSVGNFRPLEGRIVDGMNCVGSHIISSLCRSPWAPVCSLTTCISWPI